MQPKTLNSFCKTFSNSWQLFHSCFPSPPLLLPPPPLKIKATNVLSLSLFFFSPRVIFFVGVLTFSLSFRRVRNCVYFEAQTDLGRGQKCPLLLTLTPCRVARSHPNTKPRQTWAHFQYTGAQALLKIKVDICPFSLEKKAT